MYKNQCTKVSVRVASSVLACLLVTDAVAQELEEIMVTARRADETLQDAPITVDVFTETAIENAGIQRPEDFLSLVSNVSFIDTAEAGDTQVIIRGVINTRDVDQSFALVVDGVAQPNPNALNRELLDIEQIEIVKGPVSPLYGRNALGGAIIINTKKPSNEFDAKVGATVGSDGLLRGSAVVSGPIVEDRLYGRVSAIYSDFDGVFDNANLGGPVDFHEESRLRGRLIWDVTESFSLDAIVEYADIESSAITFNLQVPALMSQFPTTIDVNDASVPFSNNVVSTNPGDRVDMSLHAEWDVGVGSISAIVSHNSNDNAFGSDFIVDFAVPTLVPEPQDAFGNVGYTAGPGSVAYQEREEDDESIELRYTSSNDGPITWNVGTSYVEQDREVYVAIDIDPGDGSIGSMHPGPQTALINEWLRTKTEVYSFYAAADWNLSDTVTLSLAGRYDDEERTTTNQNTVFDPLFNAFPGLAQTTEFDKFQPRVSLKWAASDNLNLYTSYGEGYRAGGFNAPGTRNLVLTVDGLPATSNIRDFYEPEELESVEVGLKTTWMDSRLRLNVAAFSTTADNTQIFEFTPVTSTRARLNIDETEMQGFEIDAYLQATDSLDLYLAYGYTDATIKSNSADPTINGNKLLGVPEDTLNVGLQYERPIATWASEDISFFSRLDLQRLGETPWDINDNPGTVRDPVELVNLRIGLQTDTWGITAWANNLFDEEYNVENIISTNAVLGVVNFTHKGQTRTWGIDFRYRFGGAERN